MIRFVIGTALGLIGGYVIFNRENNKDSKSPTGESYSLLYQQVQSENVKLRHQVKQGNDQIDELNAKVKSLTKSLREKEDLDDDRSDNLDELRKTIQRLQQDNNALKEQLNDFKMLYTASQEEVTNLKNKL